MRKHSGPSFNFFLSLLRHTGTPENVGRGVAAGLFAACFVPVGHMAVAFLLAVVLRGARTTAVLTTWIANPLTIPVFYPAQCYLGSLLLGHPLSYAGIKQLISDAVHTPSIKTAGTLGGELIASFFAGGLLTGVLSAIIGYFLTTAMVKRHRIRRKERKRRNMNILNTKDC